MRHSTWWRFLPATLTMFIAICSSQYSSAQTAYVTEDDFVAIDFAGLTYVGSLNLKSEAGLLLPILNDDGSVFDATAPIDLEESMRVAAPFNFLLANNERNVSYAAIPGSDLRLAGLFTTNVGYTGESPCTDMQAALGGGGFLYNFSVSCASIPEPSTSTHVLICLMSGSGIWRRRRS